MSLPVPARRGATLLPLALLATLLLLIAGPAQAASAETIADKLKAGERYFVDTDAKRHEMVQLTYASPDVPCYDMFSGRPMKDANGADRTNCHELWIGFTGVRPSEYHCLVMVALFSAGPDGSSVLAKNSCAGPSSWPEYPAQPPGLPAGINGGAATWWVSFSGVTDAQYAGFLCIGVEDKSPPGGGFDTPGPCNIRTGAGTYDENAPKFGLARPGLDMGRKAMADSKDTLPGQLEDGSVDVLECVRAKLADDAPISPGLILYPVQCVFLWAFTPPTDMIPELVDSQTRLWNGTMVGKTVNAANIYGAINDSESCSGIHINMGFLGVAGGPAVPDVEFLRSCGKPLSSVASLVNLGLTLTILVGGIWKLTRLIAAFVKGPQLSDGPEQEDTRLF